MSCGFADASKNEPRGLDELYEEEEVVVVQVEGEVQTLVIFIFSGVRN